MTGRFLDGYLQDRRYYELANGKHSFAEVLKGAKNPIVLVGAGSLSRHDGAAALALAAKVAAGATIVDAVKLTINVMMNSTSPAAMRADRPNWLASP